MSGQARLSPMYWGDEGMIVERVKEMFRKARQALGGLKPARKGLDPDRWRYYRYLK
jgi:hypothetical protein